MSKTKPQLSDVLKNLGACQEAIKWSEPYRSDLERAWNECQDGSHLLWFIGRHAMSKPWSDASKPLVACALECALTAKKHWPERQRERIAASVKVMMAWTNGRATTEKAQVAREELHAAAAAAANAAYAYAAYANRTRVLKRCAAIVCKHYSFAVVRRAMLGGKK